MSLFGGIGDFFSSEVSHVSDLLSSWGKSPGKTVAQFALGAEDPLSAKLWSGITGEHFTPSFGQMGGETDAQYKQSQAEGYNTGTNQTLGAIANVVAAVWGGSEAGGALGSAAGGGAAGGGAAGSAAGDGAAAGSATADSGSVNLFADAVPGAGGDVGASAGGAGGASAGGSSAASGSSWVDYAKTAAKVIAPSVVSSLLQPKPPKTKAPTAMPDPLAQQQAQQQKLLQQLARRGRASTILTSPGSGGSLGG